MRINILTPDSKFPNLAAMKISTYHKERRDEVWLNMPLMPTDKTYASILFEWTQKPIPFKHQKEAVVFLLTQFGFEVKE